MPLRAIVLAAALVSPAPAEAVNLIHLHGYGGHNIFLNPEDVSSLRQPYNLTHGYPAWVHCVVFMTSGKAIAVAEMCHQLIEGDPKVAKEKHIP
jgi:hypothetical protein